LSIPKTGVEASDLISDPATTDDVNSAVASLELNYGIPCPLPKLAQLTVFVLNRNWTKARLDRATEYILEHNKFPTWTVADFCGYTCKLYPHSWYIKQINDGIKDEDMEAYKVNGQVLWKMKDGNELPQLERVK
jgi:hypothetical protein